MKSTWRSRKQWSSFHQSMEKEDNSFPDMGIIDMGITAFQVGLILIKGVTSNTESRRNVQKGLPRQQ